jgi:hypothetical protein
VPRLSESNREDVCRGRNSTAHLPKERDGRRGPGLVTVTLSDKCRRQIDRYGASLLGFRCRSHRRPTSRTSSSSTRPFSRWPSTAQSCRRVDERPCVDAPSDSRGCLRDLCAQVQVLPCVRPVDAAILTAAGLYGDRGSGPNRFCALEAPGHSLVFPTPSSDRCAIPLD